MCICIHEEGKSYVYGPLPEDIKLVLWPKGPYPRVCVYTTEISSLIGWKVKRDAQLYSAVFGFEFRVPPLSVFCLSRFVCNVFPLCFFAVVRRKQKLLFLFCLANIPSTYFNTRIPSLRYMVYRGFFLHPRVQPLTFLKLGQYIYKRKKGSLRELLSRKLASSGLKSIRANGGRKTIFFSFPRR